MPSEILGRDINTQIWAAISPNDLTGYILCYPPPLVRLGAFVSSEAQKGLIFADLELQIAQRPDRVPFEDGDARYLCKARQVQELGPALVGVFMVMGVGSDRGDDDGSIELRCGKERGLKGDKLVGEASIGQIGEVFCVGI